MTSNFRTVIMLCPLLACASTSLAFAPLGRNFDGVPSLIYDFGNGNVFLENAPQRNPAVSHLKIQSASGLLLPNLNLPVLTSPPVSVNGVANGQGTANLMDIIRPGFNFLGTGYLLGNILPPSQSLGFLQADLTIEWAPANNPLFPADLLYGTFGTTQGNPVLPGGPGGGFFRFFNVGSGQFFDPPMAYGYSYVMEDASLFTKVGLPLGLGSSFTITSSEGIVSGLPDGGAHIFTSGVSSFTITGINPLVDENNAAAFPVYLEFNSSTASFNMTALTVPEPCALALVSWMLCAAIGGFRRKR